MREIIIDAYQNPWDTLFFFSFLLAQAALVSQYYVTLQRFRTATSHRSQLVKLDHQFILYNWHYNSLRSEGQSIIKSMFFIWKTWHFHSQFKLKERLFFLVKIDLEDLLSTFPPIFEPWCIYNNWGPWLEFNHFHLISVCILTDYQILSVTLFCFEILY